MPSERLRSARQRIGAATGFGPVAIVMRSTGRILQREMMLYAGGASFFALLSVFPAIAVIASIYGLIQDPAEALEQVSDIAAVLPGDVRQLMVDQLSRLATTSPALLTLQGAIALLIALFAASRGTKAVITGLNHVAGQGSLRSLIKFNLIAILAVLAGIGLLIAANMTVMIVPAVMDYVLEPMGIGEGAIETLINPWSVSVLAMLAALMLLYRYVMQRAKETSWAACAIGASVATALWLALSSGFNTYVSTVVSMSLYGSLGAVIIFLLWIYWAAYILFFGGAIAVETDRQYFRNART
ncbi:MAG: membrane protein [Oceanicaulis sp. HLUCCA04]|nr:MAG: membrane protein [Oceanicaulis sp. HLUCCA04]